MVVKRMTREQISKRRFTLAKRQEALYMTNYLKCRARLEQDNDKSIACCAGCPIFEQSLAIGEELSQMSRNRREQRYAVVLNKWLEDVTPSEYELLKTLYTDHQIARKYKVRYAVFLEWKKRVVYGLEAAK